MTLSSKGPREGVRFSVTLLPYLIAMLVADLAGILTAIIVCYWFFG